MDLSFAGSVISTGRIPTSLARCTAGTYRTGFGHAVLPVFTPPYVHSLRLHALSEGHSKLVLEDLGSHLQAVSIQQSGLSYVMLNSH